MGPTVENYPCAWFVARFSMTITFCRDAPIILSTVCCTVAAFLPIMAVYIGAHRYESHMTLDFTPQTLKPFLLGSVLPSTLNP